MDYFIRQDTLARTLVHDTTNMGVKIRFKNDIISYQEANERDLRKDILNGNAVANAYKLSSEDWHNKYTDANTKAIRRRNTIIWAVVGNVVKDLLIGSYIYLKK